MKVLAQRWMRIGSLLLVEAILVGVSGLPAYAQFPDVLSNVECPGCSAQLATVRAAASSPSSSGAPRAVAPRAGTTRVGMCVARSRAIEKVVTDLGWIRKHLSDLARAHDVQPSVV